MRCIDKTIGVKISTNNYEKDCVQCELEEGHDSPHQYTDERGIHIWFHSNNPHQNFLSVKFHKLT